MAEGDEADREFLRAVMGEPEFGRQVIEQLVVETEVDLAALKAVDEKLMTYWVPGAADAEGNEGS